jgi:hypothetical protein
MREIKFRVWDHQAKIMMFPGSCLIIISDNGVFIDSEKWTPMQFTGLKDKNGKEIYEGDVIQWGESKNWVIIFEEFAFYIVQKNAYHETIAKLSKEFDTFKVIGNIYENPELLEPQS